MVIRIHFKITSARVDDITTVKFQKIVLQNKLKLLKISRQVSDHHKL